MTVYRSGPINIEAGNSANFAVEFLDSDDELTVPLSGTLSISYRNTSGASVTDVISLTVLDSFFTGTWSSASAALGIATWSVVGDSTAIEAIGQLRIIQRQSTL